MSPVAIRRLAAGLLLLALAAPVGAQSSFAWWKSEEFQKDLGLTGDQCARIDSVFQATLPKLREGRAELDRDEADLSRLIEQNVDEAQITRQVDRVEATRARLNKMRTLMLFHMRQVLTPEQRTKFTPLHDKWIKDHPRRSGDSRDTQPKK
jgi:Spy/CpxP family protein refolding chaperone